MAVFLLLLLTVIPSCAWYSAHIDGPRRISESSCNHPATVPGSTAAAMNAKSAAHAVQRWARRHKAIRSICCRAASLMCEVPAKPPRIFTFAEMQGLKPSPAARDLGWLMAFLGNRHDFVVVDTQDLQATSAWRSELLQKGLGGTEGLPQVVDLSRAKELGLGPKAWRPWMWTTQLVKELDGDPEMMLSDHWQQLHGKAWAAQLLQDWHALEAGKMQSLVGGSTIMWPSDTSFPIVCNTESEVQQAVETVLQGPWSGVYIKAEFGWSGMGNRRLFRGERVDESLTGWLRNKLAEGPVLVEPKFDRVLDFSMQLEVESGSTRIVAKTTFVVDLRGVYRGTDLASDAWNSAWKSLLGPSAHIFASELVDSIATFVGRRLSEKGYSGPVGVDGFAYKWPGSEDICIRPICDINPRYTMGRLAFEVAQRCEQNLHSGSFNQRHVGAPVALRILPVARAEAVFQNMRQSQSRVVSQKWLSDEEDICLPKAALPSLGTTSYHVQPLTPSGVSQAASSSAKRGLSTLLLTIPGHQSRSAHTHVRETAKPRTSVLSMSVGVQDAHQTEDAVCAYARQLLLDGCLAAKLQRPTKALYKFLLKEDVASRQSADGQNPNGLTGIDIRWPARDADIDIAQFKNGSSRLPKVGKLLSSVEARVECLQKFAGHELQAVELFAWALLRFPEAPAGCRQFLLRTLEEEQSHCQLYLDRIAALSPPQQQHSVLPSQYSLLGTPPLCGYFWHALESIRTAEDPLKAFLCGIGLTFEAANLDHTLKYRDIFRDAGDEDTALVLQRVHDEEVTHVKLARTWLLRLSAPDSNPFAEAGSLSPDADAELYDAFVAFPPFELAKAKGRPMLARDARRKAGLSENFIQQVEIAKMRWHS